MIVTNPCFMFPCLFLLSQHIKMEYILVCMIKLPVSLPCSSSLLVSVTLLRMVSKIHLDLIESTVKAHGYLEVVRIII